MRPDLSRRGVFPSALIALIVAGALTLGGCATSGHSEQESAGRSLVRFDPKDVAKADIDRVSDAHRKAAFANLRVLTEKLYKRNPREWRKSGLASAEAAADALFDPRLGWRHPALHNTHGTDAILLGLREDFVGDRVAAFICGLGGMLNDAFENKTEFFMTDSLDAQKLYNSARNVEIAAWKLANARGSGDAGGQLLLLSNEPGVAGQPANLSFEREFGKLIGNLDLLAIAIADRYNRTIARVVQSIASAMFLPVGLLR